MTSPNNNGEPRQTKKEITAGVVVFRRTQEGPKFLLLYHRGSYWNFPKGHLEREERSLDAALRETCEETGLKRSDMRILGGFKEHERFHFRRGKETVFKIVIMYLAETKEANIKIPSEYSQVVQNDKINGYGWFLSVDAKKIFGRHKENIKVLERAYKFISGRKSDVKKNGSSRIHPGGKFIG
ncbi:MAG: NUDIX domain-containing protein [Candidatus Liptonbacteria bacterium]|nr:NUDIX domain-containing protein [Candidatus Liptonbacteria bacterium]